MPVAATAKPDHLLSRVQEARLWRASFFVSLTSPQIVVLSAATERRERRGVAAISASNSPVVPGLRPSISVDRLDFAGILVYGAAVGTWRADGGCGPTRPEDRAFALVHVQRFQWNQAKRQSCRREG